MKSVATLPVLASFSLVAAHSQITILDTTSSTATAEYAFGRASLNVSDYVAQGFTTPNQPLTLSSVSVVLHRTAVESLYPASLTLTLLSGSGPIATLSGPGSFGPDGATATLTYTGSVALAPNTPYAIQMSNGGEEVIKWWGTDSPVETGVGTAGDMSTLNLFNGVGTWQNDSTHTLLLSITAVPEPNNTALALSIIPGAFALYRANKRHKRREA